MSLKTSKSMPVENYSVVQQSENGTQFGPMNKCRFRVPAHLGYVDFHTSYMEFDLEVKGSRGKMEFSNDMSADILIRSWRVLIGGHIIEEIDHPNVLVKALKYDYGLDLGNEELDQVFSKGGNSTAYQGFNKRVITSCIGDTVNNSTINPCEKIKCVLDLKFSGVFGSTQTFPVGMTGDVEIEIVWEEARRCLQYVQGADHPQRVASSDGTSTGTPALVKGFAVENVAGGAGALTNVILDDAQGLNAYYLPNGGEKYGVDNSAGVLRCEGIPFSVGQALTLTGTRADNGVLYSAVSTGNITAITGNDGANAGKIVLTVAFADPTTNLTNAAIHLTNTVNVAGNLGGWDNNNQLTYEISVPTLALQVVAPPQQYVAEQSAKVNAEGYSIDIPTYTCYKSNTYSGVNSATIEIPCYGSRAKSVLCIGVPQQPLGGVNLVQLPYQMRGDYNSLQQYQFQIGEIREPVRPVNCENLDTYQENVAQEQLTELEKALNSSGGNVNSLRKHRENFIVGRALSKYGGSISLAMKGLRLYLDYLSTTTRAQSDGSNSVAVRNKNWFSYVHHIRRMNITAQGINVMY